MPRVQLRTFLVLFATMVGTALASGCAWTRPPTTEDWLNTGMRSPEQTFRTYQTALKSDALDLEYRTLAESFKQREGITSLAYRVAREELLSRRPYIKKLADAEVIQSQRLDSDHHELVAELSTLFGTWRMRVELETETFFELYIEDERVLDDFHDLSENTGIIRQNDGRLFVWGRAEVFEDMAEVEFTELRFGTDWKISGIALLDDEEPLDEDID